MGSWLQFPLRALRYIRVFYSFVLSCLRKYFAWDRYPCKGSTSDWRFIISKGRITDGQKANSGHLFAKATKCFTLARNIIVALI